MIVPLLHLYVTNIAAHIMLGWNAFVKNAQFLTTGFSSEKDNAIKRWLIYF